MRVLGWMGIVSVYFRLLGGGLFRVCFSRVYFWFCFWLFWGEFGVLRFCIALLICHYDGLMFVLMFANSSD